MNENGPTPAPRSLTELIAALTELAQLPPEAQAKACPGLAKAATHVLSVHRGYAISQMSEGGMTEPVIAAKLGIGVSMVARLSGAYRHEPGGYTP